MTARPRLVVVGGGILGTMHAVDGVARGYDVVHVDRDREPRGASVRNFGLIWVSGRAPGAELALALRSRELWEKVAAGAPGSGFRANGSLTIARSRPELEVLEEVAARPDASERGFAVLDPDALRRLHPAVRGDVAGALWCARDAVVEPRRVLGALRAGLAGSGSYTWLPGRTVVEVRAHAARDDAGAWHGGDLVVCCVGAAQSGPFAHELAAAPLRRVRLQMLETAPFAEPLDATRADGDSLRYYPAFAGPALERLAPQSEIAARWRAQLLCVRRADGALTIGDTHADGDDATFDVDDEPYAHLLATASSLLGVALPPVERRWAGVYSQVTDGRLYYRREMAPGVVVVTGPGGRGMTLAPAIAEETFA